MTHHVNFIVNNVVLPGQYYDQETGLHHNGFRIYDPTIGRYIQSDPIGIPAGINTYGYTIQNPLKYSDPLGLFEVGDVQGKQIDEFGREELGGVKCNAQDKLEFEIYTDDNCLKDCVQKHEEKHIEQINITHPHINICEQANRPGFRVVPSSDAEKIWSEIEGYEIERDCLLKKNCSSCDDSISKRLKEIATSIAGFRKQIRKPGGILNNFL